TAASGNAANSRRLRLTLPATGLLSSLTRRRSGRLNRCSVDECPLVVMRSAFVKSNGAVRALARDADNAASRRAARDRDSTWRAWPRAEAAADGCRLGAPSRRGWRLTATLRPAGLHAALLRCLGQRYEVLTGDRVFVLFPEEFLLHQQVDARRKR